MGESLRGLYVSPSRNWSFSSPDGSSSSTLGVSDTAYIRTQQWTPEHASKPRVPARSISSNGRLIAKALFTSAALHYTSTAIAMPWEVGRLLLQVQYIPRDVVLGSERMEEEVCIPF